MKRFSFAAGFVFILAVLLCPCAFGDYQFDDLQGPSGVSYQWMILNNASNTFGASHEFPIDVSGDVLTTGDATLEVLNGNSVSAIDDRSLNTFYIVAVDGHAEFDVNFRSPSLVFIQDVATPNLQAMTNVTENAVPYTDTKTANGKPSGDYDDLWRQYKFQIDRNRDTGNYDTVAQYFYFQQNPDTLPSQGIPRPMIIANVSPYSAQEEPLELRMTLRDTGNNDGNITAYDRDTWYLNENKTTGGLQWVFVPVDNLNTDNTKINYYLTTEVVNHTSYRYAAYDGQISSGSNAWIYPYSWRFDLPRFQGANDIVRDFQLAPASHIAPGLVSVYKRAYNVNEENKRPLRLFPVDDTYTSGLYDLRLNHRIIYGKRLGETYKYSSTDGAKFNLFEITAYQPRPNSMNFYDNVARITGSTKTVSPATSNLTASSVSHTQTSQIPNEAVQYFTVNHTIPGTLRSSSTEGIMPLHITINIPVTQINDRDWWNDMLTEWRNSGSIEEMFADKFEIFLLTETDGTANPWNLSQELQKKGIYSDQIKVFFDEERGRITQDNDRGLITVSFIVMLMNGTRDGVRPELSIVPDNSVTQDKDYIVIRDGNDDNKWKMTFFIAPSGYVINPEPLPDTHESDDKDNDKSKSTGSSGGGGGCNSGMGIMALSVMTVMIYRKER
ncbi:MAG: hypothetical protein IJG34_07065 [Synergistaceae bacterium]|nr:hypothetical protein [Synergistaceae bacterium]